MTVEQHMQQTLHDVAIEAGKCEAEIARIEEFMASHGWPIKCVLVDMEQLKACRE